MKKNLIRTFAAVAVGLIAVCASVTPVAAQNVFQGKFTLSHEVRWQDATLPAGDYTFALKSTSLPIQVLVQGPRGAAILLTSGTSTQPVGEASNLTIQQRAGASYVSDMFLAPLGVRFHYALPEIPKGERELAQGPVTTEHILIASN